MMRASSGARKESKRVEPLHDVVWRLRMWERQEGRR